MIRKQKSKELTNVRFKYHYERVPKQPTINHDKIPRFSSQKNIASNFMSNGSRGATLASCCNFQLQIYISLQQRENLNG